MNTWVHKDSRYGEIRALDLGKRGLELCIRAGQERPCCVRCHRMVSLIISKDGKTERVHCVRTLSGLISGRERTPSYCPMNYLKGKGAAE